MLVGGGFVNAAVQIGSDGVLVVDTMTDALAEPMIAEIKRLAGDKPIRWIVNTHAHPDHTGGNAKVAAAGRSIIAGNFAGQAGQAAANFAQIIAHENTGNRLAAIAAGAAGPRHAGRNLLRNPARVLLQRRGGAAHSRAERAHRRRRDGVLPQVGRAGGRRSLRQHHVPGDQHGPGRLHQGRDGGAQHASSTSPCRARSRRAARSSFPATGGWRMKPTSSRPATCPRSSATGIADAVKKKQTLAQVKAARLVRDYEGRYGAAQGFWTTDAFVEAVYRTARWTGCDQGGTVNDHGVQWPGAALRRRGCCWRSCSRAGRRWRRRAQPPAAPARRSRRPRRARAAPIDLTGYWVSIVNEDWRWRMVTPPKGDVASVPLNPEGTKVANAWDPATDGSCLAYGAAGLMRMPTRLNITWQDDSTIKIETDAGQQTRLLRFDARHAAARSARCRGIRWRSGSPRRSRGRGGGRPQIPRFGNLRVDDHEPDRRVAAEERRPLQRERHGHGVLRPLQGAEQRRVAGRHDHRVGPEVPEPGLRHQHATSRRSRTARSGARRRVSRA